jgi:hypothetical protein
MDWLEWDELTEEHKAEWVRVLMWASVSTGSTEVLARELRERVMGILERES